MRIKQFFYKIVESNRYKDFLLAGLDETKCKNYVTQKIKTNF